MVSAQGAVDAFQGHRVAVVSMPFYTQYSSCLPAFLLREIIEDSGDTPEVFPSHIDFALRFIRSQDDHRDYKRLGHEGYLADLTLLPLMEGWGDGMSDELESFAGQVDAPPSDFRRRLRDAFHAHLEKLVEALAGFDIVALTATHYQLVPSLLLAQMLRHLPAERRPKVVIGGYFASIGNAQLLLDNHPCLDLVVFGEAEDVWPAVRQHLADGVRAVVRGSARDFRKHFARQDDLLVKLEAVPWLRKRFQITLELSRGCYWDKCDFCNFNASYDAIFKSHAPKRVVAEMDRLEREHGQRRFQFTDTAVPRSFTRYLKSADLHRDWDVFIELRPDFEYDELRALGRLGRIRAQIGIESLVESHLYRMNKNATIGDNVRALLMCQQLGIAPTWAIFVGHPHETIEELRQTLDRTRRWRHLPPPRYLNLCELRAGSSLDAERGGLLALPVYPCSSFSLIMPLSPQTADLVPVWATPQPGARARSAVIDEIRQSIQEWRQEYEEGTRLSGHLNDAGEMIVQRTGTSVSVETLDELAGRILANCVHRGRTPEELTNALAIGAESASLACADLVEQGMAFWSVRRRSSEPVLESLVGGLFEAVAPDPTPTGLSILPAASSVRV